MFDVDFPVLRGIKCKPRKSKSKGTQAKSYMGEQGQFNVQYM